MIVEERGNIE